MIEKVLEESDKISSDINKNNLIKKIWLQPSDTLKFILKNCPEKNITLFLVLGGVVRAIDRASRKNMGDDMSTIGVLLLAISLGALFGWISYYIYAWAMSATGEWLGGKSEPSTFRTILAWSLIPSICTLLLLLPEVIILGDDLFKSEPINESFFNSISWILFGLIEITLGIWSLIILVKGISIIQDFGIVKSIINLILPVLVLLIPIIVIALLINM